MSEELSKQVKEERGARGEECACHKEKTPKYPKWREWRTEKRPRWGQQGWRWSPRVRAGPSWAATWPHVLWAQWPKQIKAKTNILSCLPMTRMQGRLPSHTVSENWWRSFTSCLGGSLPRLLHLPLESGLMDTLHFQAPLHQSLGFLWLWRNCCETEFSSVWHLVHSMSVYFCCARRGTWYLVLSSAELSPQPWGGSKQQSLHATELVHHWAPASVSLFNTSRYLLRLEVCSETLVPNVYWVPETVMECWGWC